MPIIPEGFQIYERRLQVMGVKYRKDMALKYTNGRKQLLVFERESNNIHDSNAIKVIGESVGSDDISLQVVGCWQGEGVREKNRLQIRGY